MRNAPAIRGILLSGGCLLLAGLTACSGTQASQSPASRARVSRADRAWLGQVHQADMAEMQAGQLAQARGGTSAVRAAGTMLYRDHQSFDITLARAATSLRLALPAHETVHQTEIGDRLASEPRYQFDSDFLASMISAHERMIAATAAEITRGSSPQIVTLARQALPVLRKHLAALKAAAAR
jgi:putative membrane protein